MLLALTLLLSLTLMISSCSITEEIETQEMTGEINAAGGEEGAGAGESETEEIDNNNSGNGIDSAEREVEAEEPEAGAPEYKKSTARTHDVSLITGGFAVDKISIKAGDSVMWINEREDSIKKAMIVGTRQCRQAKSDIFYPGEHFKWTFNEAGTCVIVDGIYATESMKVVVE